MVGIFGFFIPFSLPVRAASNGLHTPVSAGAERKSTAVNSISMFAQRSLFSIAYRSRKPAVRHFELSDATHFRLDRAEFGLGCSSWGLRMLPYGRQIFHLISNRIQKKATSSNVDPS